jgi:hypothetical protein
VVARAAAGGDAVIGYLDSQAGSFGLAGELVAFQFAKDDED